jgi:hypothetical protein
MPMVVLMIWMIAGRMTFIMVMMRMAAVMRVVVVGRPMIVVVMMIVTMIVIVVVSVIMAVVVGLRSAAFALHVSPAFGIERRLERNHPSPEPRRHRLDHRVAADAQRFRQHFGQEMPVAEVPGDAGHRQGVGGPNLRQRFGFGQHLDHASIFEPQPIAAAQHRRLREIEQEFEPSDPGHGDAPAVASVEVQYDRVGRSARPMAGRDDFVSAQHLYTFRLGRPRHWESRAALTEFEREAKQTPAGL